MISVEFVSHILKLVVLIVAIQEKSVHLVNSKNTCKELIFFFLVFGKCSHMFHSHCMISWIELQKEKSSGLPLCPMCRQSWEPL